MNEVKEVKVIAADRLEDAVIMTFNDGRSGMYSAQLLHTMLASAHELHDSDNVEADVKLDN